MRNYNELPALVASTKDTLYMVQMSPMAFDAIKVTAIAEAAGLNEVRTISCTVVGAEFALLNIADTLMEAGKSGSGLPANIRKSCRWSARRISSLFEARPTLKINASNATTESALLTEAIDEAEEGSDLE